MVYAMARDDTNQRVTAIIREYCASPENTLENDDHEPAWGAPLVGFSRGDDPIFRRFKEAVGCFHWTPREALLQAYPGTDATPSELVVISWVLPQTEATRQDSRQRTMWPPERWARSRIFGEAFNDRLRAHLVARLRQQGYEAVAPGTLDRFRVHDSDRFYLASTWSERHAAHASGLGTFGLCDGLITPAGKAMRVGSVIARLEATPTPRPYRDHQAYCLFFAKGTCGECMQRCPVGAITPEGHDKAVCRAHVSRTHEYVEDSYGFQGYGCGLCQTGVPCESGIPEELFPDRYAGESSQLP